jgi:diaminohydroxyphosphoribosylaminopyrimidine deaminase / 5-amino-6-(5-phosphoribosylamino)uracil reductase
LLQKRNTMPAQMLSWTPENLIAGHHGVTVLAQLGQSLDGQIATSTGQSKYINSEAGLVHLHRLRAWADVVIVGVGTVLADDPQLTVRQVSGRDPARLVLDPKGRAPGSARLFQASGTPRVILTQSEVTYRGLPTDVDVVQFPANPLGMEPDTILQWLAKRGWTKVLVEGGALTIQRFMMAGRLDYLHLITSPVLLGAGKPGLQVPTAVSIDQAKRCKVQVSSLGKDLLITCDLR